MDWVIFSESEPANVYTGRLWIKPSTSSAFLRLGSIFVPVLSGGTPITMQRNTYLIDGEDKTIDIQRGSLSVEDILNQEADTCSFIIEDTDGDSKPFVGAEVQIFHKETAASTPVLIFGGRITEAPQARIGIGKYQYEVTVMDYTQDLTRVTVVDSYEDETAGDIIKEIIQNNVPGIGTFFVEDGLNIDFIAFNYANPSECIQRLADLTGHSWYVDAEKNLHFFDRLTNLAPYELTEGAASGDYKELVISVDKSQLKNKQKVRGGYELSALYTQEKLADGTQTSFAFDYTPFAPISVYLNIGGAGYGAAETLGIDNIDSGASFEFVYNANEKVIKNENHALLTDADKIKITYKYKKPILAQVIDKPSVSLMKTIEGGNGIYEAPLIIDETIETKEAAKVRGQSELDQFSNPLIKGTFLTTQYGYRSGQLLTVNIPTRDVNSTYLIKSVTATSLGNGVFEYSVVFATKLKGLTEFLLFMYDASRGIDERTDENLHTYEVFTETISVSAAVTKTVLDNVSGNPHVWSNDAETTLDRGFWNLAEWN